MGKFECPSRKTTARHAKDNTRANHFVEIELSFISLSNSITKTLRLGFGYQKSSFHKHYLILNNAQSREINFSRSKVSFSSKTKTMAIELMRLNRSLVKSF